MRLILNRLDQSKTNGDPRGFGGSRSTDGGSLPAGASPVRGDMATPGYTPTIGRQAAPTGLAILGRRTFYKHA